MHKTFLLLTSFIFLCNNLDAQTEPKLMLPVGHTFEINSAVFSPDGTSILTTATENTAKLWDVKSGKLLQNLEGLSSESSAIFSPDGKLALTASLDNTARLYELITGKELQVLSGHTSYVNSAVFSSDGKLALTASEDKTARIYEVATGKELQVLSGQTSYVNSAVFSSDGKLALTASGDKTARIYEVATGKELQVLSGHSESVNSAVFSSDGKLVLTSSYDNTARIYEVETGKELHVLSGFNAVFSPDGKLILSEYISSEDTIARIYEVATGKELQVLSGYHPVFSPDGKKLALTTIDHNTAHIYEVETGKELQVLSGFNAVFSPDGKLALTIEGYGTLNIYEVPTGKQLQVLDIRGHARSIFSAVFSPDAKLVLTASGIDARIFELTTGKQLNVFNENQYYPTSAVFSPDGKLVLSSEDSKSTRIHEVSTGKELHVFRGGSAIFSPDGKLVLTMESYYDFYNSEFIYTARIYEIASVKELEIFRRDSIYDYSFELDLFSPDGKLLLIQNKDKTMSIYEVETGKELQVLSGFRSVFSPDSKLLLFFNKDRTLSKYDVSTGKEQQVLNGPVKHVISAVFSPDGKLVLTASGDSTARIYEVSTGKELQVLSGHSSFLNSAVFSPDGKLALTASADNTTRIYEVSSGRQLQVLKGKSWITSVVFSPDGRKVLITSVDGNIILWDVESGKSLFTLLQLENNDWLVYDENYRFDGTPGAIDYLYLTCGLEVIDLAQVKDSLWVPGLVEKIMNGDSILINDRPAPKLKDLNICDLTPVIEPIENGDKGFYRFKIIPRNGGLGETEVYINGNFTYKFKPDQLEKKFEQKKEIYYLSFSSDTLQGFLTGEKNSTNPILMKAKVKGSGIYGRGVILDVVKNTEKENPKFYGVFIGVNDYSNPNKESSEQRYRDLDFAKKDADDLSNAVEATARNLFKEDCHIYRLTGTGNSETAPTKANIQKALKEIGEKAKASDILYIFFAGHGDIPEKSGEKEIRFILHKADKKNLMSSSFGVEELSEWCHPKNIKAQKRVFVFDACHSGQLINQTMDFNGRGDDEATRIRQLDKLKDKNGMMILAAAADNESAYEDETLNQGVLTYHLLQVMKEQQKDTSLVIRSWFDETIDLVKDYSRANGNKQEPNSFGDGRFEIGNINNEVRQKIEISCPKTRIGMCVLVDPTGDAELIYPQLKGKVNQYFASTSSRGNLVFSKNLDWAYRVEGTYVIQNKKVQIRYKVFLGDKQQGEAIELPAIKKNTTEDELIQIVTQSIQSELERIDKRDEKCKRNN